MSDKNIEPEKTMEKGNFIDNVLRASELAVVDAADSQWRNIPETESKIYNGPARIWMRGITNISIDTRGLDHKRFAGWGINLGRSYGPHNYFHGVGKGVDKDYPEMYSDKPEILKDNDIEIGGAILMRNQREPEIIDQEIALGIANDIAAVGLTGEVGYKFIASVPQEVAVPDAPFQYDNVITIAEIRDVEGKSLDLKIEINLGFSDSSSKEANIESALDSQQKAQESLDEGALVSTGFTFPRTNRVDFSVTSLDGEDLKVDDPGIKNRLEAGILIGARALEIVLDNTSDDKDKVHIIDIRNRTPQGFIDAYTMKNPDFDWINDLVE